MIRTRTLLKSSLVFGLSLGIRRMTSTRRRSRCAWVRRAGRCPAAAAVAPGRMR